MIRVYHRIFAKYFCDTGRLASRIESSNATLFLCEGGTRVGGTAQSKNPFIFYFGKKRVRLSTLPKQKKTKKNTSRALVSGGLRRQNLMFAKNGENMSATMAKFVFGFAPRRGDCAKICLVVVSAGGLPTRLRKRSCVSIR